MQSEISGHNFLQPSLAVVRTLRAATDSSSQQSLRREDFLSVNLLIVLKVHQTKARMPEFHEEQILRPHQVHTVRLSLMHVAMQGMAREVNTCAWQVGNWSAAPGQPLSLLPQAP
eukprot:3608872-Pleurochrysis_carterae.AAC.1